MIYDLLAEHRDIIVDVQLTSYERLGSSYRLVMSVTFNDYSALYIRDYLFENGDEKYAYHYQRADGILIFRYDNEPHWPNLPSFPHHKHLQTAIIA